MRHSRSCRNCGMRHGWSRRSCGSCGRSTAVLGGMLSSQELYLLDEVSCQSELTVLAIGPTCLCQPRVFDFAQKRLSRN